MDIRWCVIFQSSFRYEKRFCLDWPDNYYSWIKGDEYLIPQKRHSCSGGLMLYGLMTFEGFLWIKLIGGSLNSKRYQDILILAINDMRKMKKNFIWMHDGAPAHRSKSTKNWPARSPYLNIIKNDWRLVYIQKNLQSHCDRKWSNINFCFYQFNF